MMTHVFISFHRLNKVVFEPCLNPFPRPGTVRPTVGAVRSPSGHRERPRGRPDPPDGSPGPWEHKEGGHQRTRLPNRPSAAVGARWRLLSRQQAPGMLSRGTMAPVCPIRLPRWPRRAFIRSNTCAKGFWTVPMPCWLKRAQLFGATSAKAPTDEGWTAGPESGARAGTCSLRRNGCGCSGDRVDGRGALGLDDR